MVKCLGRKPGYTNVFWRCSCACGSTHIDLPGNKLTRGTRTCCGCAFIKERHGYEGTPTYGTWKCMHERCNNENHVAYESYGGRGIKVCKRWSRFSAFLEDMGNRPRGMTIDRIDNDKGYSKSNCRWATAKQQQNNRRDNR